MFYDEYVKENQRFQELLNQLKLSYLEDLDKQVASLGAELFTKSVTSTLYKHSNKKIELSDELLKDLISDISLVKNNGLWDYQAEADRLDMYKKSEVTKYWLDNVATPEERAVYQAERKKQLDKIIEKCML